MARTWPQVTRTSASWIDARWSLVEVGALTSMRSIEAAPPELAAAPDDG